jgi:hypothetical protein
MAEEMSFLWLMSEAILTEALGMRHVSAKFIP